MTDIGTLCPSIVTCVMSTMITFSSLKPSRRTTKIYFKKYTSQILKKRFETGLNFGLKTSKFNFHNYRNPLPLDTKLIYEYYSTLSQQDIMSLQQLYKQDFLMFDYQPSYVFRILARYHQKATIRTNH